VKVKPLTSQIRLKERGSESAVLFRGDGWIGDRRAFGNKNRIENRILRNNAQHP